MCRRICFGHVLSAFSAGVRCYEWHIAVGFIVLLTGRPGVVRPELERVSGYILDWREAAIRSEARVQAADVTAGRARGIDDECRPSEKSL